MRKKQKAKPAKRLTKPKSPTVNLAAYRYLIGIGYLLLGLLIFISNLKPTSTGVLGHWLVIKGARFLVGDGVLILPFYCVLGYMTCLKRFYKQRSTWGPLLISFLCLLVVLTQSSQDGHSIILGDFPYQSGWLIQYIVYYSDQLIGAILTFSISMFLSITLLGYCFDFSIFDLLIKSSGNMLQWIRTSSDDKESESKPIPFSQSSAVKPSKRPLKKASFLDKFDLKSSEFKPIPEAKRELPPPRSIKPEPEPEPVVIPEAAIQQWTQQKKKNVLPASVASLDMLSNDYALPSLDLLEQGSESEKSSQNKNDLQKLGKILEDTLLSFNVEAHVVHITAGPSVTRFELQPGHGVKISKITALSKDIALKLAAPDVRIEAPIPGKALIGIEVPNLNTVMITMRTVIESTQFYTDQSPLTSALGMTINGDPVLLDICKMPHLLIAGATGSGKSVCINSIILSILMRARPDEVKLLMIDPKKVELSFYDGIPHLIAPVVTNPHKAAATLKQWALVEMERRYEVFSRVGVKNLEGYNAQVEKLKKLHDKNPEESHAAIEKFLDLEEGDPLVAQYLRRIPYIVVIIDELADLMMVASQDVETTICRLAQMARATGIHLVIATQRPSVNVITGLIKANVPSRISFFLQSQIDSRTIIDMPGAEKLLGKGDMLYSPVGSFKPNRIQGVYVSEKEVRAVVDYIKAQAQPDYEKQIIEIDVLEDSKDSGDNVSQDDLYDQAKDIVMQTQYASTSYLQRKLRIGYNRAARLMDELETNSVISAYDGEKKSRKVIVP